MSRSGSDESTGTFAARRQRRRVALYVLAAISGLVVLLGVLNVYAQVSATTPHTGVVWADTGDGVVAVDLQPGGPAARSGLMPGDRLVMIADVPVSSVQQVSEAPWGAGRGEPVVLEVERGTEILRFDLSPEGFPAGEPLYTYLATVGLFFLASALYLLYRLGASTVTGHYWVLSLAAFWLLVFSHTGSANALDWLYYTLDTAGRVFFPAVLLHFVLVFPGERRPRRRVVAALYAPAVLLGAATVWLVALRGAETTSRPLRMLERLDAVELMHMALWLTAALVVLATRSARETTLSVRRQLRWSAGGLAIGMTPFVLFYLIPRALQVDTPPVAGLSVLPLIILPLAFSTAILKYRLADLGLIVKSGVTVLTLTFFSLAVFLVLNLVLRETLGGPGINRRIFTVLAGILVFFLYPRLRSAVGSIVDRAFYQGRYDHRRTLDHFVRELNAERELMPLMRKLHDRVRRTLPVGESVLLFPDVASPGLRLLTEECDVNRRQDDDLLRADSTLARRLEEADSVVLDRVELSRLPVALSRRRLNAFFPMRVKGRVVAVLAVSVSDGEELNSEDSQLLETLAAHAAAAMEGARLSEENRERMREVELLKDYNESIVESTRVGILVVDDRDRVRGWNRAMEEIFGRSRSEVSGRPVSEVFPPRLVRLLASSSPRGRRPQRHNHIGPDGGARTLTVATSELHGPGHRGKVVSFDDVSDQLRLEQQLVQSERLASVGLLASGVAHEVNTPLTGITSYAQMLLDEPRVDDDVKDVLGRISKQSWRASHIVNSLLSLARAGQSEQEVVDLNDVVEETLSLFGPQLKGRDIDLRFTAAEPDTALLRGQKGRLQQVVLNLLMNARDAMPAAGRIRIVARAEHDEVVLEVTDTGAGIPAEDLGRIYDPFFTTKRPGQGTGLGLSIVYGIVRDHGGAIHVDSTPGESTRFIVRLPAWHKAAVSA